MKKNNNIYMLKLLWKFCRKRVCCEYIRRILQNAVSLYTGIVFLEYIINAIEQGKNYKEVVIFIALSVVGILVVRAFSSYCFQIAVPIGNQVLFEKLNLLMFKKVNNVEIACYENTEFYKKYTKAASQIKSNAIKTIEFSSRIVAEFLSAVYIVIKLVLVDKYAILIGVLPLAVTFALQKTINKKRYELDMKNLECNRKKEYVNRTMYQSEYAKEIRLTNIKEVLFSQYHGSMKELKKNIEKYGLRLALLMMVQSFVSGTFVFALVNVYAAVRLLVFKDITTGGYVILGNLLMQFYNQISAFTVAYGKLNNLGRYVNNLRDFLEYEPKIAQSQDGIVPLQEENILEFKNVSFTYGKQGEEVLKNINFKLKQNEVVAIVGHNGSGKTTLAKLLMRLYDPTQGEIKLNNKNIKEYQVKGYRNLIGSVFQDYGVLALSVAENVMMQKVAKEDEETVRKSLKLSGVYDKISSCENEIHASLTKEFDEKGIVLSGGEKQKIAISRVFAKKCKFVVLDEPSSALDPVAEFEMYQSMKEICKNKGAVFISHRMASAVMADYIYYMENGEIVEEGTHQELMKMNKKYAELFNIQAESYRRKTNE